MPPRVLRTVLQTVRLTEPPGDRDPSVCGRVPPCLPVPGGAAVPCPGTLGRVETETVCHSEGGRYPWVYRAVFALRA